jgi:adenylylsulfate kinase-like enzyme
VSAVATVVDASSTNPLGHGRVCLLVTGPPGAGKSTVSRMVAAALKRSALLDGDWVSGLIVSGRVWALGEPADETARQVALCNDNLCSLATNLADAGFTPVIDWVVPNRVQLDVFRRALGDRLRLIVLDPGTDACPRRDATRPAPEQFLFDGYAELHTSMDDGFGGLGWWFDTSAMAAEPTVEQVLAEADQRARVPRTRQ